MVSIKLSCKPEGSCVLAADIGASHARFGVFCNDELLGHTSLPTEKIDDLYEVLNKILTQVNELGVEITDCGIGVAGPIRKDKVKMTHAKFEIDIQDLFDNTQLGRIVLINDFQAAGYGINLMDKGKGKRALIGPGTGLGHALLVHNGECFIPFPSERGDEYAPCDKEDMKLFEFIENKLNKKLLSWEDIVSGTGLENIYEFYTGKREEGRNIDDGQTIETFSKYLAYCCRGLALTFLPEKVYVTGGAVNHRPELFSPLFRTRFEQGHLKEVLKDIEVELISDDLLGLKGAAYAITKEKGHRR